MHSNSNGEEKKTIPSLNQLFPLFTHSAVSLSITHHESGERQQKKLAAAAKSEHTQVLCISELLPQTPIRRNSDYFLAKPNCAQFYDYYY